jgi:hypothetical protein
VDQFKKYQAKKNELKKQMKENIKKKRAEGWWFRGGLLIIHLMSNE